MDRGLSVYDRLEQYATRGRVFCELNLYSRQIDKLLREGFAVQRGFPVAGWKGQYHCKIGWLYALPNTFAWDLLEIAASNNDKLKEALKDSTQTTIAFPYESDLFLEV